MSTVETGQINVQTDNIFPIIKKFLYSDHEIFLRELVSNAVDATQKLSKLSLLGEVPGELGDLKIEVKIDEEAKTLTISDKGIGMSAEEVKKYINQIAFSSAQEFLDKFKSADEADATNIIGHFGLGFYSSFMVADQVDIVTKTYKDAPAVKWTCDGSPNYTLEETEKEGRGTDIILHINEENKEYLEKTRVQYLLDRYCKFLPVEIKFGTEEIKRTEGEGDDAKEMTEVKDVIVNDTNPAWTKSPSDMTDEDYINFYHQLYPMAEPPMFWIHLNVDYPFNLTGILYFPKLSQTFEVQKNKIQLYSNQVFVTDSVENIVPEFLMHMHGVIDSPDIPLNVSRSYLQSDPNVKKINSYITRKVADKLAELFKEDREAYQEKWDNIHVFVKYGMLSEEKFYEKAKDFCLFKNTEDKYFTIEEYKEHVKAEQTDKNDNLVILYTSNPEEQDAFVKATLAKGYDVLLMDTIIDNHFLNHLEMKLDKVNFKRVDSDTLSNLIEKDDNLESVLSKDEEEKVQGLFTELVKDPGVTVVLKALSPEDKPAFITRPEWMRRMKEMSATGGGGMMGMENMPDQMNLVVNTNHPLVSKLLKFRKDENKKATVSQLYDLALLSQGMLRGNKLTQFINRSFEVMG